MSRPGDRIAGRYELEQVAGEGGMATVWRALAHGAAGFSRVVAVKEIKSEYGALQSYVDMFVEEARVGSDLAHPNIVQVYDFLEFRDRLFLVMEWVEGVDLDGFVASFRSADLPTPWQLVAAVAIETLRGLSAAHRRRRPDGVEAPVIHRDVSPTNVLLSTCGAVKITDFGLARARDRVYSLTAPGTVKGKLSYLSPEVTFGRPATPKSDQFSLGAVLWEALTGERLFESPTDVEIFRQIRACEVPPLEERRPDIPPAMAAAVHRALARKPAERFRSLGDMIKALIEVLGEETQDSTWELQDELARTVEQVRTQRRSRLPLPADGLRPALLGFDPDGDPSETGPAKLFGDAAVVQFVEHSDSEVTTMPEHLPGLANPEPTDLSWQGDGALPMAELAIADTAHHDRAPSSSGRESEEDTMSRAETLNWTSSGDEDEPDSPERG
ncbi:serine/threonine-protein kinase [Haliangium sp.]|uniref:serine/threonine-protein kinase n=1 Tax=Haliangium sp. TaxID=2663208 RepID=UPI003D0C30FD